MMANTTGTVNTAGWIQEDVVIGKRTWRTVRPDPSAFAAELDRTAQTQAADKAKASGEVDLESALGKLSTASKELLDRLKLDISKDEWRDFLRDLKNAGLISGDDLLRSDPDLQLIGYTDPNGDPVFYPPYDGTAVAGTTSKGHLIGERDTWTGNPFQTMYQWLDEMWKWKTGLDDMVRPNGVKYDTSHITQWMEDRQKVYGVISKLMELA